MTTNESSYPNTKAYCAVFSRLSFLVGKIVHQKYRLKIIRSLHVQHLAKTKTGISLRITKGLAKFPLRISCSIKGNTENTNESINLPT